MRVLIGTPTYDRRVDIDWFRLLIKLERLNKYEIDTIFPVGCYLARSRNICCQTALKEEYDWLLFLDSDTVIYDENFLDKMLQTAYHFEADIVCGAYRQKTPDDKILYPIGKIVAQGSPRPKYENFCKIDQPQLIDAGGTGIMLISKKALKLVPEPWFTVVDGKGLYCFPEDWEFCYQAQQKGLKIAVDPSFQTAHFGPRAWIHP